MHEPSDMNDPVAEKLGRFTPSTAGFDRDALLFQAGQASVRPPRWWPTIAGLLALSQAATLLFFLTRPPETLPPVVVAPKQEMPAANGDVISSPALAEPRQWSYHRATMTGDLDDLPRQKPVRDPVAPDKVLTVLSLSAALAID